MTKVVAGALVVFLVVTAIACSGKSVSTTSNSTANGGGGDAFFLEGSSGDDGGSVDSGGGVDDGTVGSDGTMDDADAAGSDGASSVEVACTDLITAFCGRLQACAPFAVTNVFGDAATCVARERLSCPSLFNSNGTGATPSGAQACAQAYTAMACDDFVTNRPPSACVFNGSVAPGAACGADAQCASTGYCNVAVGQTCGVCSPQVAVGGTCRADGNCQRGLVCFKQNNAPTGSCVLPGGQGATCDATDPCLATLGCGPGGTCGPALGAGAPCSVQNCDLPHGLYCNTLTGVCAQVQDAADGMPCGITISASFAVCTASERCAHAAGSTTSGTCEATAADGAACDATGPLCLAPAVCQAGVCTLPDASSCH